MPAEMLEMVKSLKKENRYSAEVRQSIMQELEKTEEATFSMKGSSFEV